MLAEMLRCARPRGNRRSKLSAGVDGRLRIQATIERGFGTAIQLDRNRSAV